jgi:acetone carboxylase gamma subunit
MERLRVTEYLDLDLEDEGWYCHVCGNGFGSARGNYKEGCLIHERDPREIHRPIIEGEYTFAPDPEWVRIVEFSGAVPRSRRSTYPPGTRSRMTSRSI